MTDPEIRASLADLDALALTLFGEARGEPVEGRIAVGSVIRNRVKAPRRFGTTYAAVCHARAQFSCWFRFGGEQNYKLMYDLALAIIEHKPLPLDAVSLAIYEETRFVAEGIADERLRDRVRGATHYYAPAAMVPRDRVPDWAIGKAPVAKVGSHLFFVGV